VRLVHALPAMRDLDHRMLTPESRVIGRARRRAMDLQEVLAKVAELSREELHLVRKRAEERTPARDHGQDFDEISHVADQLDHYAHVLRRLHDNEFGEHWRHESRSDRSR
jgi:Mg2+ and Co2+ transporter CorA